jgi:hypothetical protein
MKTLLWTALVLGAALSTVEAQNRAAAVVDAPQGSNAFVASSSSTVTVVPPSGPNVTLNGTSGHTFSTPYDIVSVPRYNRMVVSNLVGGTVSVFSSDAPFTFVTTVTMPGAIELRGMSVSGDEEWVFIAGRHAVGPTTNPAVFQLRMSDLNGTLLGEIADDTRIPEDVVVINASQVGGTGSVPGKVYFSVPSSAPTGYIGVIPVNPAGPITRINVGPAAPVPPPARLVNVTTPTQLERSPDHSVIFGGCTTLTSLSQRLIRVVPGPTDTATDPVVRTLLKSGTHTVLDIAFRPFAGPGHRAYVNALDAFAGAPVIIEVDENGTDLLTQNEPTSVPQAGRIRFDSISPLVYIGTTGTGLQYGTWDPFNAAASVSLVGTAASPRAFAFALAAATPVIATICPKGQVTAPLSTVEIQGGGFVAGAVVVFINNATGARIGVPETVLSSGAIQADVSALPTPALYDVEVTNPDAQVTTISGHYLAMTGLVPSPAYSVTLPSRFQGYEMRSFPQYFTLADLNAAVTAQLGGYNPSNIRIFIHEGGEYVEASQVAGPCDLSGRPFWVLTRFGATLTLSRPSVADNHAATAGADQRVVPLYPGWNMIAQPHFDSSPPPGRGGMRVTDILVYDSSDLSNLIGGLPTAVGLNAVSNPFERVGGQYVELTSTLDRLEAGQGYWIRNNNPGLIFLSFQQSDAVTKMISTARSIAPRAGASPVLPPPAPPGGAIEEEEAGTSGCGLPGLELLALLGVFHLRSRRKLAA